MAEVTIRTTGRSFPTLTAWLEHVKEEDLPRVLPAVAIEVLRDNIAGNNPPSNIIVDGRGSTPAGIVTAKRRVQLMFLDTEGVIQAVELAWNELQRLYKRRTGESAATIQIWGHAIRRAVIHERISSLGAVRQWVTEHRHSASYIRLVGPTVPMRRQLYYSPAGEKTRWQNISRVSAKRLAELQRKGGAARVVERARGAKRRVLQVQSTRNVSEVTKAMIGSRFGRTVYVSTRWVRIPVTPWSTAMKREQGVPTVAIGWPLRGATGQIMFPR